jgi:uncharacterized protein (TIGR02246 family)
MKKRFLLFGAVLVCLAPVYAKAADEGQEAKQIRASLTLNYHRWVEATKQKDVEGVLTLYADDAIVLPPGRDAVRGREAIREFYKGYYSGSWKLLDEQFKNTSLILQDDLAIETADYSGEIEHGQMGTVRCKGRIS